MSTKLPNPRTSGPLLMAFALLACVSTTPSGQPLQGAPAKHTAPQATAAAPDPPYLQCMSKAGNVRDDFRTCQVNSDCVLIQHRTCLGSNLDVAVARRFSETQLACEDSWRAHAPACETSDGKLWAEDGVQATDVDPPSVHCVQGACRSFVSKPPR